MSSVKVILSKREFGKRGTIKVEALGFVGKTCEAATAQVTKALGTVLTDVKKSEYYAEETVSEQAQENA